MVESNESFHLFATKEAKGIGLIVLIGGLSIVFLLYFNLPVIDNLGMKYLRDIKPEDRGLDIQNVTGYSNGLIVITLKNEGKHSVVMKDVILKDLYTFEVKRSINKEIFPQTSDIVVSVWFTEKLKPGLKCHVEVFTQRGSYIGKMDVNTTFSIKTEIN